MGARSVARGVVRTAPPAQALLKCVPLYAIKDPKTGDVDFFGTGTLVRIRGLDLLVTAAHVIQNGSKYILMVAGPETPLLLNRSALVTPVHNGLTRESDPMDLCVIRLTSKEAAALRTRCRFIEWGNEALMDMPLFICPHRLLGYSEIDAIPNYSQKTLPIICSRIDFIEDRRVVKHAPWPEVRENPARFVGLRYDPRLLNPQEKRPKIKSLHGCSGGAIWRTDSHQVRGYAGMVVQCQSPRPRPTGERIIFGIRAKTMDGILTQWITRGFL